MCPLVIVAAHWFRGIHPARAAMEPAMRAVLIGSAAGFTALFFLLLACRRWQLQLKHYWSSANNSSPQPESVENRHNIA